MVRRNDREAWTALIEGRAEKKRSKFNNNKTKDFDSNKEAGVATNLDALARAGRIRNLQRQVPITILEGKGKVRGIIYKADFVYDDPDGTKHILDAKGFRTSVYLLKKKMLYILHGITIEEV